MSSMESSREGSGKWMPLRFLYFIYYVFCKRDQMRWPVLEKPVIGASVFLIYVMAWPIYALLILANYFIGWVPVAANWWVVLHLPILKHRPDACAFITTLLVIDFVLYLTVFNKRRRYQWIMTHFGAYDVTKQSAAPAAFVIVPLVFIMGISILSTHANPVRPNLIIWAIIACTEIAFRGWWHLWSKRNVLSQHGRDASRRNPGQGD